MDSHRGARPHGTLLLPFLEAADEAEAQRQLERLVHEHAAPIIRSIIGRKWRVSLSRTDRPQSLAEQDAEDIYSEVVARLLARLRDIRCNPGGAAISNFRGYVAVTTYRACDLHLRQKYPQRWSLQNRLRYLLTHQPGLALWDTGEGEWLCGFAAWCEDKKPLTQSNRLQQCLSDPHSFVQAALPREDPRHAHPADLLAAVFNKIGHPVELDDLVALVAELWGIKDQTARGETGEAKPADPVEHVPDPYADVAREIDQRAYLQRLWQEIHQLPPRQCAALLLNLRDEQGRGVIALLPLMGIATLRQIAAALAMPVERFAALWNDLPLDDATIARQLGVTRQQVINLRKVARERLTRRMKRYDEA